MLEALHLDWESKSALDLREAGLHRYARHVTTDIWLGAYAFGEEEPDLWWPGHPCPPRIVEHVKAGGRVIAWNAPFEIEMWNEIATKRYGWPELDVQNVYCAMAMAYSMALPGALEDAALALGLPMLKDVQGRSLMLRYARPWRTEPLRWMDECPEFTVGGQKYTGAEGLQRLGEYSKQDVRVERELHKRLVPLSDTERRVWLLDYKINQRGVAIDVPAARAAVRMAERVKEQCNLELAKVTGGAVQAVSAVGALKEWMASRGVVVDSLAKQALADLLEGYGQPVPVDVHRALTLRQEAGKASTAKFDVMLNCAGEDGRLRQMYQYHGASTGRWAGRKVQTHNLPRDMPPAEAVEQIMDLVKAGEHDAIDAIYGPPLTVLSKCLRSFFIPAPGHVFITGDWSNVESRGGAWFANEEWKLQAFRAQDAKTGPDVYKLGASRLLGIPVEKVTKDQRQAYGKVPDLAFLYQGGVGSGHTMGKTYGVTATDAEWAERRDAWRAAHPRTKAVWREIERAAINAVRNPGEVYSCGHPGRQARLKMVGSFLWALLPSGRAICYPKPKLLEGEYGPQLTYMVVPSQDDKKKGKVIYDPNAGANWVRIATYGGSLFNNFNQGWCRDFLAGCMLSLDNLGAQLVMHTHDSIAVEVLKTKAEGARQAMERKMQMTAAWAKEFPLFAECEVLTRYRG